MEGRLIDGLMEGREKIGRRRIFCDRVWGGRYMLEDGGSKVGTGKERENWHCGLLPVKGNFFDSKAREVERRGKGIGGYKVGG